MLRGIFNWLYQSVPGSAGGRKELQRTTKKQEESLNSAEVVCRPHVYGREGGLYSFTHRQITLFCLRYIPFPVSILVSFALFSLLPPPLLFSHKEEKVDNMVVFHVSTFFTTSLSRRLWLTDLSQSRY